MSGILFYSTSDGDGRGNQSDGTDVIEKVDLTVWAPAVTPPPPTQVAPSAPQNLQQSAVANNPTTNSIQMSWAPPATGTPPYTYNLAYATDGTTVFTAPTTGITGTTFTQTGLFAASLYIFQVQAVDSLGQTGPWTTTGATSTAATNTPVSNETANSPPMFASGSSITNSIGETFVMVAEASPNQGTNDLKVNGVVDPTFTLPNAPPRFIVYANHTVFVARADTSVVAKVAASQRWVLYSGPGGIPVAPVPFDPLTPGTPPGPVGGPTHAAFNLPGSNFIQITWQPPLIGTGPFSYLYAYKLHSTATFSAPIITDYSRTSTDYIQMGLSPSTAYDFEVAAVDAWNQQGPFATLLNVSTAALPPPPPTPPPGRPGAEVVKFDILNNYRVITWVGSTANCAVYYNPNQYSDAVGIAACNVILSSCEQAVAFVRRVFAPTTWTTLAAPTSHNPSGSLINVILDNPGIGAAAFHGINNADIFLCLTAPMPAGWYPSLIVAELAEDYMGQLGGLATVEDAYGIGEGLSQNLAALFNGPIAGYPSTANVITYWLGNFGSTNPRPDYINNNVLWQGTTDWQNNICCNLNYFNWLRHKGWTFTQIFAAINTFSSPCSGRQVFNVLNHTTNVDPFPLFNADINAVYSRSALLTNDQFSTKYHNGDLWNTPF